jgi:hypothetical protein
MNTTTIYTKEFIQSKLSTDVKWIERGIVVLYNLQTQDEKESTETKWENGVGYNSSDSRYLTYCAKWIMKGNKLSGQHLDKCSKKLPKYWKQIQSIILKGNN